MIKLLVMKNIRDKKNRFILIIFSLCSLLLMSVLIFKANFIQMQNDDFANNIAGRTLVVTPAVELIESLSEEEFYNFEYDFAKILSIEHVQEAYSSFLETSLDTSFKSDKYDGVVYFKYGTENTLPNNIVGQKFTNNDTGVVICPFNFYPDSNILYRDSFDNYLSGNSILDSNFDVTYEIPNDNGKKEIKKRTFKVIGLYDNTMVNQEANTCFMSAKDLYNIYEETLAISNEGVLTSVDVVVDNLNNLSSVINELNKLNYNSIPKLEINVEETNNLKMISYICICFILIVIISVTIVYVKKRNVMNIKEIGLLSALGFSNNQIQLIYFIDMLFVVIIAIAISTILSIIVYFIVLAIFKNNFIRMMYRPKLFFSSYIINYLMMILIPSLINYWLIKLLLHKNINSLIKEDEQ